MATLLVAVNRFGQRIGEDHPLAKLTNREADRMLELREQGYSYTWLAKKFDVSKSCARWICTGRNRSQIIERFVSVSVNNLND